MARHLPPLAALRAFEAAARNLGFARAGAELGVTPGAISHQIKLLETWVGHPLFTRKAKAVALTEAGRALASRLGAAFDQITAASLAVRTTAEARQVIVQCQFSLAAKWLAPLMARFQRDEPHIAVTVSALPHRWDMRHRDPDLSIYHARDAVPGLRQDLLVDGHLIVVAPPSLVAALPQPATPAALLTQPLIHVRSAEPDWMDGGWEAWFASAGFGKLEPPVTLTFNLLHLAIEACLAGAGFALVPDFLVAEDMKAGRLVDAFGFTLQTRRPYMLMASEASLQRAEVRTLHSWLLAQRAVVSWPVPNARSPASPRPGTM